MCIYMIVLSCWSRNYTCVFKYHALVPSSLMITGFEVVFVWGVFLLYCVRSSSEPPHSLIFLFSVVAFPFPPLEKFLLVFVVKLFVVLNSFSFCLSCRAFDFSVRSEGEPGWVFLAVGFPHRHFKCCVSCHLFSGLQRFCFAFVVL